MGSISFHYDTSNIEFIKAIAALRQFTSFQSLEDMAIELGYTGLILTDTLPADLSAELPPQGGAVWFQRVNPSTGSMEYSVTRPQSGEWQLNVYVNTQQTFFPVGNSNQPITVESLFMHEFAHVGLGHLEPGVVRTIGIEQETVIYTDLNYRTQANEPHRQVYNVIKVEDGATYSQNKNCFPAGAPITMWPLDPKLKPGPDGVYDQAAVRAGFWTKLVEEITTVDLVLTYDAAGNPVPGIVDKLFTNTTQDFVRLTFADGRDPLVSTPGHRFLTETGDYMEIGHMLRLGGGTVRMTDTDGSIVEVIAQQRERDLAA